jgi:arsenate reductase
MTALDEPRPERRTNDTVVFVCEHGSVKSLIAAQWFFRLASERGLAVRAVSRGVTPDASVPSLIEAALARDGFDVSGFEPRRPDAEVLANASRVVAIGVDPRQIPSPPQTPVEAWEGIPAATDDYAAAREAMKERIQALIDDLDHQSRR